MIKLAIVLVAWLIVPVVLFSILIIPHHREHVRRVEFKR